jgi:Protein of unknown function (DUF2490)
MKRSLICLLVCLVILACTGVIYGQSVRIDRTDTQNWNDVFLSVPVAGPVDFVMQGTIRNGRDISRPVDERIGVGFSFKIGKYLTVIPNYLHIGMQPFKGRRVFENRLSIPATVRFPVGKFTFSDRNLFERRLRHPGGDSTRYRNRLQIDHPIGPVKRKISLFVSDEVFYDWSFNAWVRNRAAIGMIKVFNKHFTLDLYYMRQNDSHSVPGDLHIIGTVCRFKL